MLNQIIHYLPFIFGAAVIITGGILYRTGLKNYAKQLLLCLVRTAEESYGAGTGAFKFAAVASMLYDKMPAAFRMIFTRRQVAAMIEAAVEAMKRVLSSAEGTEAECKSGAEV